eukprot:COSAG01_NODE_3338_length_6234_cov_2.176691_5_plen_184_part_00
MGGGRAAPEQLRLVAAELRQIVATGMQALGCVAERAVLRSDVATCAAIADCLLDCAGSEEVGSGSGGTPDAATAIPELARESAAHGLIRLASNGRNALDEISVHRAAVTGCDVSGNHRHHFFVCGFATEAALRCSEGEQTPVVHHTSHLRPHMHRWLLLAAVVPWLFGCAPAQFIPTAAPTTA